MPTSSTPPRAARRFCLVLVKPSHYDDDGYVIQWFRSAIPSNSLAALYGLARDCARAARPRRRRRDGDPSVRRDEHAHPSRNDWRGMIEDAGAGMVMLVGVQSNQFPRALDLAQAAARARHPGRRSAASTSPARSACSAATIPISHRAQAMGVSLFAGEAEGRLEQVLRDAYAGDAQAALQLHGRPAEHRRRRRSRCIHGDARLRAPPAA